MSASARRCGRRIGRRLQTFDFAFDLTNQYTFWSGTIAALFLFCSYFGTDQSQVQRYLTAKSVDEARSSLLMSAYWKIPLQALVLLVGVLHVRLLSVPPPPMLFNAVHEREIREGPRAGGVRGARAAVRGGDGVDRRQPPALAGRSRRRSQAPPSHGRRSRRAKSEVRAVRGEALALVRRRRATRHTTT